MSIVLPRDPRGALHRTLYTAALEPDTAQRPVFISPAPQPAVSGVLDDGAMVQQWRAGAMSTTVVEAALGLMMIALMPLGLPERPGKPHPNDTDNRWL